VRKELWSRLNSWHNSFILLSTLNTTGKLSALTKILPKSSANSLVRDVLKSPREKRWWLGDGIDLVNKAKAMGYGGSSRKYETIVWLRSTPEDAEVEVEEVVEEPTPNKKRKAEGKNTQQVSKRPAKGSKRPHGWDKRWPS